MKIEIRNIKTAELIETHPIAIDVEEVFPLTNGGLFEKVWRLALDAGFVNAEKQDDYHFTLIDDSYDGMAFPISVNRKVRDDIFDAHKHSIRNKDEILDSETCGCFCCLAIMKPDEINHFTEEKEKDGKVLSTAWCPHCLVDTIIAANSGYPITKEFLREMNGYWCSGYVRGED